MTVTRETLWEGYPDGWLEMHGASTVGGYLCCGSSLVTGKMLWWHYSHVVVGDNEALEQARLHGELLPNLDPVGDPATWACALRDLAEALWPGENNVNVTLRRHKGQWLFGTVGTSNNAILRADTDDPATALCLARASLRERKE